MSDGDARKRTYEKGRPIIGWFKGKRLRTAEGLKAGQVLIMVSHQFQAENLVKVVRPPKKMLLGGFMYVYASPNGKPTADPQNADGMFLHEHELGMDHVEVFLASREDPLKALMAHAKKHKVDEHDLDEVVHDIKSGEAADVNNGGMEDQLEFILEACGGDLEAAKRSIS